MNGKTLLKGFTLVEMIIVMVIIGILAVVLTESYISISKTALRIEQEKNISEESLILTQVFQAISDEATIDYDKYIKNNKSELIDSNGFTDVLYLTGGQWKGTKIYTIGDCPSLDESSFIDDDGNIKNSIQDFSGCSLVSEQDGGAITPLTTLGKVIPSKVMFRIIPFDSDNHYLENASDGGMVINDLHQPAFWMFIHLYAPLYQPTGINKVDLPLQLFFNLNL